MTEFKPEELEETTKYITLDEARALISTSLTNFSESTRVQSGYIQSGNYKVGVSGYKLTSDGIIYAVGAQISGYITVGGAATDINNGVTTISGGKITTNSIAASTIITGQLVVGTNVGLGTAQDSAGVTTIINGTVTTDYLNAKAITVLGAVTSGSFALGSNAWHVDTSGNMWWGSSATYAGATIKISAAGSINFTTGTFSGAVSGATISGAYFASDVIPYSSSAYDLGSSTYKWRHAYFSGNLVIDGTVDGIDVSSHASNASAHHSSASNALAITPSTIVASSTISGTTFNTTTGVIYYGANAVFDMYDGYVNVVNQHLYPSGDNSKTCGKYNQRWSDIRTVLINGADYGFENNWYLTENYRVGIKEDGIAVLNSNNELVMFMGKTGLYVKSGNVKNVDELPYIKTTIEQRAKMDINPEIRIHETDTEILEIPISTDAKIGGANYKEKKIIIKANKKVE